MLRVQAPTKFKHMVSSKHSYINNWSLQKKVSRTVGSDIDVKLVTSDL